MPSNNTSLSNTFQSFSSSSGLLPPTAPVTLYSSAPASVTNPSPSANPSSSSLNSPQNNASTSATNSPQKQLKTIPTQQQQSQTPSQASGPASSPSSGATTNTPAMANTSLKRKQASDAASPTVGNSDQVPPKRIPRKRVRGGTGTGS